MPKRSRVQVAAWSSTFCLFVGLNVQCISWNNSQYTKLVRCHVGNIGDGEY